LVLASCSAAKNAPTERDVLTGGYWYNEDKTVCFVFDSKSSKVSLYSINAGAYTYNFGNVLEGKYSIDERTITVLEEVRHYVLDGNTITIGEDVLHLSSTAPTLNTVPMTQGVEMLVDTGVELMPANPGINEKSYLRFTPDKSGEYVFDFALSTDSLRSASIEGNATYIWILDKDFKVIAEGDDLVKVEMKKASQYYVVAEITVVSSVTGTNTLTVSAAP
jgi:hypothetical protein